ncbi:MAG: hypothetical protein D6705_02630 [Deltaproteobacteria bacterium]|nr:MAG: hypothetical protein D6705_02630 [Deltaproteobacteria bacterium]
MDLGLARPEVVAAAAAEPAWPYLAATGALLAGLAAAVLFLRRRPLVTAIVILALEAGILAPAARHMTGPGLSYHAELLAHHWAAVAATLASIGVAFDLAPPRPPLARWTGRLATVAALGGAVTGLAAHVVAHTSATEASAPLQRGAVVAFLVAIGAASLARTVASRRIGRALAALVLLAPLGVRVATGGSEGLVGEPLAGTSRIAVAAAMVAAGIVAYATLRPRLSIGLHLLVQVASGLAVAAVYVTYTRFFGEVDGSFDALARSFLGFSPPYPPYVPEGVRLAMALGLFCTIATVYAALVSAERRAVGLALAVAFLAGVGLTSPQTVLMAGAGWLAFVAWALPDQPVAVPEPPPLPTSEVFAGLARMLNTDPAVVVGTRTGRTYALDAVVCGVDVRVRGRLARGRLRCEASFGAGPSTRPRIVLEPAGDDATGMRPLHPVSRTHRIRGGRNALEAVDEAVLDALLAFPTARIAWSEAGAHVDFGTDLARFEPEQVAALLRAVAHWVAAN